MSLSALALCQSDWHRFELHFQYELLEENRNMLHSDMEILPKMAYGPVRAVMQMSYILYLSFETLFHRNETVKYYD